MACDNCAAAADWECMSSLFRYMMVYLHAQHHPFPTQMIRQVQQVRHILSVYFDEASSVDC